MFIGNQVYIKNLPHCKRHCLKKESYPDDTTMDKHLNMHLERIITEHFYFLKKYEY